MKVVRIWFVLLLVVLLPVKGVMAAAMLCPASAGAGMQSVHADVMDHEAMGHSMAHGLDGMHGHVAAGEADDVHGHDHTAADKCNTCSAYCSLTPLVSSLPSLPVPLIFTAVRFPALASAPPTFLSDGQERPPRTL